MAKLFCIVTPLLVLSAVASPTHGFAGNDPCSAILSTQKVSQVYERLIRSYFDRIPHQRMLEMLKDLDQATRLDELFAVKERGLNQSLKIIFTALQDPNNTELFAAFKNSIRLLIEELKLIENSESPARAHVETLSKNYFPYRSMNTLFAEFSSDGSKLLTINNQNEYLFWEVSSQKLISTRTIDLPRDTNRRHLVQNSATYTCLPPGAAYYFEQATPPRSTTLHRFTSEEIVSASILSRDGKLLVAVDLVNRLRFFDPLTHQENYELRTKLNPGTFWNWLRTRRESDSYWIDVADSHRFTAIQIHNVDKGYSFKVFDSNSKTFIKTAIPGNVSFFQFVPGQDSLIYVIRSRSADGTEWNNQIYRLDLSGPRTDPQLLISENRMSRSWYEPKISQDGKTLIRFHRSSNDIDAIVIDTLTGHVLGELKGHTAEITSAAFSPDGKWIATSSEDKTVRIWDRGTLQVAAILEHEHKVTFATFSPDSLQLTSGGLGQTLRFWNVAAAISAVYKYDVYRY